MIKWSEISAAALSEVCVTLAISIDDIKEMSILKARVWSE